MGYCTEQILIQFLIGFIGSLFAGGLIALLSQKLFNQTIKESENNIISSVRNLHRIFQPMANDIKRMSDVVDALIKGLEKKL